MISDKYIPGHGPISPKIMIIGEAPSYEEVEAGRPFVGAAGRELDRLLKDAKINRHECWVTNVCKYMVTPSPRTKNIPFAVRAKNDGIDITQQISELQVEVNSIQPNVILALGGTALWATTGKKSIQNYRGSIMLGMGRKLIPTYHPAHLLYQSAGEFKGYWNRQVMIFDMKRALAQSHYPELNLPSRALYVAKNSAQFQDYLDRNKTNSRPAIDIEAGGHCIPICIGISFSPNEGITIPLWNKDGISNIPNSDLITIWRMVAEFLAKHDIIGQNFKYDQDKLFRLGFTIKSLYSDTMLKSFAINPELPKKLAFNQSIYTEEPFYKDEGMYAGTLEDLLIGCARDACVTKEIDLAMDADIDELGLRPFYENFIMKLHSLYLGIESEGLCVNEARREELLEKYIAWDERLRYEMFSLVGVEINWNSPKQVSILLYNTLGLPYQGGTGEEILTDLLKHCKKDKDRRIIEIGLESRRVRKTISTYLMALTDFDGKMKTTYFLCNETGRSSTSQQEPPVRPYIKIDKKNRPLGAAFQTMTKHGDIGHDVRSMYEAPEGYVFIQADSSQAEARVVFLLAEDEEALSLIDTNDYHAITASWFFGGKEEDYSKKVLGYETPVRFIGKTLRHACHLGAKGPTAAKTVNTDARKYKINADITVGFATRAIEIFHKNQPSIRRVFQQGIIKHLERSRVIVSSLPYGIDAPFGGKRTFFERWGDELFRQAFSYIPQRTVTENTKAAALRIHDRVPTIRIILESHDSLLFCVRQDNVEDYGRIIKEEFERPISFANCTLPRRDLVIPCELEIGSNYQELKKFKFMSEFPLLERIV